MRQVLYSSVHTNKSTRVAKFQCDMRKIRHQRSREDLRFISRLLCEVLVESLVDGLFTSERALASSSPHCRQGTSDNSRLPFDARTILCASTLLSIMHLFELFIDFSDSFETVAYLFTDSTLH